MANLALADLVLPYVFRGENIGPSHAALSALRVVTFETSVDDLGVTLRGHCEVNGSLEFLPASGTLVAGGVDEAAPAHDPSQSDPVFDLRDTSVDFELFVPRQGSAIVSNAQSQLTSGAAAAATVLTDWQSATPQDFPSTGFTFDLILNAPKLRPPFLHPAKVSTIGVLEPDTAHQQVAITLPRLRFRVSHGNPDPSQLAFSLVSAGVSDLDDPGSTEVSEMISMDPPYAYIGGADDHVVGIGFRSATLDLDGDWTPPALRDKTGVGDDWTGLYLPEVRVFVAPDGLKNLAFECGAQELLIGVGRTAGIWGDFDAALVQQGSGELKILPRFIAQNGRAYGVVRAAVAAGVQQASAQLPAQTTLVVDVTGGRTPYARVVKAGGTVVTGVNQEYPIALGAGGTAEIDIEVTSGSPTTPTAKMHISVTRLNETARIETPGTTSTTDSPATIEAHTGFDFELVQGPGAAVTIVSTPPEPRLVWSGVSSAGDLGPAAQVSTEVAGGTEKTITVRIPGSSGPTTLQYFFFYDCPGAGGSDAVSTTRATSKLAQTWTAGPQDPFSAYQPQLAALPNSTPITITGDASYETPERKGYNTSLAWRRAMRVKSLIESQFPNKFTITVIPALADPGNPTTTEQNNWVTAVGWGASHAAPNDRDHWLATVSYSGTMGDTNGSVRVKRLAPTTTSTTVVRTPPDPPVPETSPPPDWFRSVKVLVRIVDSQLIAVQLDLEVDINTVAESKMHDQLQSSGSTLPHGRTLQHGDPVPNGNPADGITKFRVLVQTDPATGRFDTLLSAGADPADTDGLFHFGWLPGETRPSKNLGLTMLGSYLSFWPLLAAAPPVDAVQHLAEGRDGAVVDAALAGAALTVPAVVAALPWFTIERVILYGVEYFHTQRQGGFTGNFLVDVEMDWSVNILDGLVEIKPDRPLKVRYKAIGLSLTNRDEGQDRWAFRPIFDASRGYTIDVASGGGLHIGDPLGQILRVLGARMSRSNPMTLEVDIGLAIDLGVVSIDRASVRAFLTPDTPGGSLRAPELTALAASVDIPGALVGSGYMAIGTSANGDKTIGGQIDLTIRPVSVRVAAALEVTQFAPINGRSATGVFVSLNVVLPAGIPLANSGLGIFGFRGIFGMHYKRADITGPSAPALEWLKKSEGQPHKLVAKDGFTKLWEPKIDNWAFGIGILIGTMEGGTILNLDGTFLLELPGPRVIIILNAHILSPPPSMDGVGQAVGILAIIEITPEHFLIGILVTWEIEDLVKIVIPVEAVFPFGADSNDWHIYLGAHAPYGALVEVDVLGIVKGTGYLMFRGKDLATFNNGHDTLPAIKGFAIAMGLAAGFTWGDVGSGLYLRLGGGMDAVMGFDPFILVGNIWVVGELRLWIVSIGADASLTVKVSEQPITLPNGDPSSELALYVHGKACGHVDFFFFSVSGCVEITISGPEVPAPIPSLVEKVSLQSRSPALAQGSGVDRGMDVSLGTAVESASFPSTDVPVVPIDAIPVISFTVPPGPDGTVTIGALGTPLTAAPGVDGSGYAVRGSDSYRYVIKNLRLERVKGNGQVEAVTFAGTSAPVAWWSINPAVDANPAAQLALLTWQATPATKAIEFTDRLVEDVTRRWGRACSPAAPPAEVLWTFKLEPLGPSDDGWDLEGVAWPDPPQTERSSGPDTGIRVTEPWRTGTPQVDLLRGVMPALVTGGSVDCHRRRPRPEFVGSFARLDVSAVPTAASGPRVVVGGVGAVDDARPSGELLPATDEVRSVVAPHPDSLDVRISGAFHDKATAALGGLRELADGGTSSLLDVARFATNDAPMSRTTMHIALQSLAPIGRLATPGQAPATPADGAPASATGSRCPVKALLSPIHDDGRATNFPDPAIADDLAARGIKDEDLDLVNRVHIHSGAYDALGLMLFLPAAGRQRFAPVVARVLAADGSEIDRVVVALSDLLSQGRALPSHWTDLGGPWGNDIDDLVRSAQQAKMEVAYLELPRHLDAAVVEVGVPRKLAGLASMSYAEASTTGRATVPTAYFLAAASRISGAEVTRADWDTTQIAADRTQLTNAVGPAASDNSLLKANSRYRITVEWSAQRAGDGRLRPATAGQTETQVFWFRTDTVADDPNDPTLGGTDPNPMPSLIFTDTPDPTPVRLDPWVMVTLPDDGETGFFGREHLKVVFNTHDVDRLFTEYGKELRLRIEAANGQHPSGTSATPHPLPITSDTIDGVPAVLKSPWEQAVDVAIDQWNAAHADTGETFCVAVDSTRATHGQLDIDIPLDPFMDYLLDIEIVPTGSPTTQRGPRVFRRHFRTGGFGTLGGFAWSLSSTLPTARFCQPGTFSSMLGGGGIGTRPLGSLLDNHLLAHQIDPLPVPDRPRVVVFWEQTGSALPQPAAVLLDASEPLSRSRTYPTQVVDTTTSSSAQRWILAPREWLTVSTGGDAAVAGIVWAPGNQRAFVVLASGQRGKHLSIDLVAAAMPDLPFLDDGGRTESLADLLLGHAPWEEV